jgi:hypothetical protein
VIEAARTLTGRGLARGTPMNGPDLPGVTALPVAEAPDLAELADRWHRMRAPKGMTAEPVCKEMRDPIRQAAIHELAPAAFFDTRPCVISWLPVTNAAARKSAARSNDTCFARHTLPRGCALQWTRAIERSGMMSLADLVIGVMCYVRDGGFNVHYSKYFCARRGFVARRCR